MNEVVCPNCKKAFKIDESGYADILKQVKDQEFANEINERLEYAKKDKEQAIELAVSNLRNEIQKSESDKEVVIRELEAKLNAKELEQQLAISQAVGMISKERDDLFNALEMAKKTSESNAMLFDAKLNSEINKIVIQKNDEIQQLQMHVQAKELEIQLTEKSIHDKYILQINQRDEAIVALRDMKAKLSTKMVGESLEQHCENEFNKIRAAAFPKAYFEKDNDAKSGTKGDYIFRDYDDGKNEVVSIMFEMKNIAEGSNSRKNEEFLKKLDADRVQKKCEYAVLVSMLEPDNDLYNTGIVVSHQYDKMFIIRPQFFVQIIALLRNAALNSLHYKKELFEMKSQNIDITNFEGKLEKFKTEFSDKYSLASRQYFQAIAEIDNSIKHLQKTKEQLEKAERSLRLANDKSQDITIKKLIYQNPTMQKKFSDLKTIKKHSDDVADGEALDDGSKDDEIMG